MTNQQLIMANGGHSIANLTGKPQQEAEPTVNYSLRDSYA